MILGSRQGVGVGVRGQGRGLMVFVPGSLLHLHGRSAW